MEIQKIRNDIKETPKSIFDMIKKNKGQKNEFPKKLKIKEEWYRGQTRTEEGVIQWYNEMADEKNPRYIINFNVEYSEFCRRNLVKLLGSEDMKETRYDPLTPEELKHLIHSFPSGKASDALGLSHDMLKALQDRNIKLLTIILNDVIEQKHFHTPVLNLARFSILYKGHGKSKQQIGSYRRITIAMVFNRILDRRINKLGFEERMITQIESGQYGFKQGESFTFALWEIHSLMNYSITNKIPLYLTSHDCEKYFPSINWLVLCWETFSIGLTEEEIRSRSDQV